MLKEDLTEEIKELRKPYEGIKGAQNIWKPIGNRKYEDLTGKVFGRLTVVKAVGRDKRGNLLWLCRCTCSNRVIVQYGNLKRKTRSCGCIRSELLSKQTFKDLTGKVFGRLTVVKEVGRDKHRKVIWEARCSCGNYINVPSERLLSGQTQSCGCLKKEQIKERCTKPIIGKTFGRLTVIKEAYRRKGRGVYYECLCSCGNTVIVQGAMLRSGNTKSCGCISKENRAKFEDLSGQKFGKLTVIKRVPNKKGHSTRFLCKCECGGMVETTRDGLLDGSTLSCGCIKSKGEWKISQILSENNIEFEKQKTFDDLRNSHGIPRFDFYIPEGNYLIEYDGEQHFMYTNLGWNDKEHHEKVKERDEFKNNYCREHGITLIRIPYTRYNELCLEDLLLETSKFTIN